jgi:hypothetical protein
MFQTSLCRMAKLSFRVYEEAPKTSCPFFFLITYHHSLCIKNNTRQILEYVLARLMGRTFIYVFCDEKHMANGEQQHLYDLYRNRVENEWRCD